MNIKSIFYPMVALAVAATLAGCDENAWNDHLDGFGEEEDKPVTEVTTINLTLENADYEAVASNSTNLAIAGDADKAALADVGSRHCFNATATPGKYLPAFLADKYYYLDNGSAISISYRTATSLPAVVTEAAQAQTYTVTEDDYKTVWDSEDNYIDGFAPSHPASKYITRILKENCDNGDGNYCVVSYNASAQEPVFGNAGGDEPEAWTPGDNIGGLKKDDNVDLRGVITAICQQGYIITDNSGSIFMYMGSSFDPTTVAIGQQINVSGTIGAYNGGLQVTGASATVEVVGTQAVTYPTPTALTGAVLDEKGKRTGDWLGEYVTITGKLVVTDKDINILVDGASTSQGSIYQGTAAQKAMCVNDETVTVRGYLIAFAGKGKYASIVVTDINGKPVNNARRRGATKAPAVEVPLTSGRVLYTWENGNWVEAPHFSVLTPADYRAMGQSHDNLTDAARYLPTYLKQKFPYAAADDVENVMYLYYRSSDKTTYYLCDQYIYNGSEWVLNDGIVTETAQFVKNKGVWNFDPSVTVTVPNEKGNAFSMQFYQACVDWVYKNKCVPLGDTSITSGKFWVSKYGNNEVYSGTSAHQCNVDLRASAAREQYAAGFEGMTDDQVVEFIKNNLYTEVIPAVLPGLYPDAKPVDGLEVLYTIHFGTYDGSRSMATAVYRVTAPATFEPVSVDWSK